MKVFGLILLLAAPAFAQHKPEYVVRIKAVEGKAEVRCEVKLRGRRYLPGRDTAAFHTTPIVFYINQDERAELKIRSTATLSVTVEGGVKALYAKTGKTFHLKLKASGEMAVQ